VSFKSHFSKALAAAPNRIHLAAHSHYLWPDVSFDAQVKAWEDAATFADQKWDRIFGEWWPRAQRHVARTLRLSDPRSVTFSPNTHDFIVRIVLSLSKGQKPVRILTTDSEFHSFRRQVDRWEEDGVVQTTRVPVEPTESFELRFLQALDAMNGAVDLVFFSEVFFRSGYRVRNLPKLVAAVPDQVPVVIDGYHSFMATPTDYSALEKRVFYTSGGYKYAMSGEGVCFLHAPPGYIERPLVTGWYASFGALAKPGAASLVAYADDGSRFLGSTFDASGIYRFVYVQDWLLRLGLDASTLKLRSDTLADAFRSALAKVSLPFGETDLLVPNTSDCGMFLSYKFAEASRVQAKLQESGIITDVREDRLRISFGLYHDAVDMPNVVRRMQDALA
jgi:kynureninase